MRRNTLTGTGKQGFALIVVLFALAILTLMFSAASTRTLASVQFGAGEALATQRLQAQVEALDALVAMERPKGDRLLWGGRDLRLQPTAGLVDLNTATPALLDKLLAGYGLTGSQRAEALTAYRDWRYQGRRLLRVSDFARALDLTPGDLPGLETLATVHSLQARLTGEQAPMALLEHLTGARGDRALLVRLLGPALQEPASALGIAVFDGPRRLGVVGFHQQAALNQILAMD